jgi:hypothetical protein
MARPRSELGDIRTSPRNRRLLKFLRRKPAPAKLVGETDDGDEVTTVLSGTGPATYTDACGVLRDCIRVQALDDKDRVLRRLELDPDDPELLAETETREALRGITRSHGGSVPIISVDLPKLVDNIARNMREVAGEAARQNANAHRAGFDAMVSVVNIALNLLVGVEQRLARAEDQLESATVPTTAEPVDERQKLALMALQKAMGGAANGSGGIDPAMMMQLGQLLRQAQSPGDSNADG